MFLREKRIIDLFQTIISFLITLWGGDSDPLQSACLENPMDRGAWRETVLESQRVRHDWATKHTAHTTGLPCGLSGEKSACNTGGVGSTRLPRSPGGGNGKPLQCSRLGNPKDREAWRATACRVAKESDRLSDYTTICTVTSWEPETQEWINREPHSHGEIREGCPGNKIVNNQMNFTLSDSCECSEKLQHGDMWVTGQSDEEWIRYSGSSQETCLKIWGSTNTEDWTKTHITNIIGVRP